MSKTRLFRMLNLPAMVLTLLLAACGQRGPLYLPDESAAPAVPAQPATSEDALEAELDDEDNVQDGNLQGSDPASGLDDET